MPVTVDETNELMQSATVGRMADLTRTGFGCLHDDARLSVSATIRLPWETVARLVIMTVDEWEPAVAARVAEALALRAAQGAAE